MFPLAWKSSLLVPPEATEQRRPLSSLKLCLPGKPLEKTQHSSAAQYLIQLPRRQARSVSFSGPLSLLLELHWEGHLWVRIWQWLHYRTLTREAHRGEGGPWILVLEAADFTGMILCWTCLLGFDHITGTEKMNQDSFCKSFCCKATWKDCEHIYWWNSLWETASVRARVMRSKCGSMRWKNEQPCIQKECLIST